MTPAQEVARDLGRTARTVGEDGVYIFSRLDVRLHPHRKGIHVTGFLDGDPLDVIARDPAALVSLLRSRLRRRP
jgi:hypothetical protein